MSISSMPPKWLSWIDPHDHKQLRWVANYLEQREQPGFQYFCGNPHNGDGFLEAMANREHDAKFKLVFNKMRAAWRQKKYRETLGNQFSFQLSGQERKELSHLAKKSGMTNIEIIRQLLSEASNEQKKERAEVKNIKEKRNQEKAHYLRIIDSLIEAISEEMHQRFHLEKQIEIDKKEELTLDVLEKISAKNNANIEVRIKEVEEMAPELKFMRLLGGSLRERLTKLQDRDA